jgi:hypothetical protein
MLAFMLPVLLALRDSIAMANIGLCATVRKGRCFCARRPSYASLSKKSAADERMDVATVLKRENTPTRDGTRLDSCLACRIESVSQPAEM